MTARVEKGKNLLLVENIGKKLGFLVAYIVFSVLLFFLLSLNKKLPSTWSIFHIMALVLLIPLIGNVLKKFLR